jgi:DNA-binding transcriptional ArsR family regulator
MNAWRVVELLAVLGEETRYGLIAMLVQSGEEGMPQSRLHSRSGLTLPRLKRHVAKLVKVGLVRRNYRKKGVVWKIDERQLGALVDTLSLRLKPQLAKRNGHAVVIETPKGFRTLASKLAAVLPKVEAEPRDTRSVIGRTVMTAPVRPRLPARLTEAIKQSTGTESADSLVEAAWSTTALASASSSRHQAPMPPALAAPAAVERSGVKRKLPARLSDAIAGVSG